MLGYKISQVASFLRFSSFNSTRFLNENERYKTDTNLFMNINNNTAPFVSITWLQKGPLGCVVYSHCPTNDSCNKYIHSCCCCLPCNYVTKPFGILQRIIKNQRVHISEKSLKIMSTIDSPWQGTGYKRKINVKFLKLFDNQNIFFSKGFLLWWQGQGHKLIYQKKLWQYQNSHLDLYQKEEIALHNLEFSPQHLWMK